MSELTNDQTSPFRILVVDDSDDLRAVFCTLLKRAGYETLNAKSGAECLRIVAENPPDLVLLDVILPDTSGVDVCKAIKSSERSAGVLVLNISGVRTSAINEIEGLEGGADGYITKPIDGRTLIAHVNALLRMKKAEQEIEAARDELENKILQRTAELVAANTFLQREIADRKRVEEALLAATTEWEQTFNAIPDQLCIMDLRGVILRANKAMRDQFEPMHGNLVGLDYRLCYCGTATPEQQPPCAAVLTSGLPVVLETAFPVNEGSYLVASYPLRNGKGEQWGAISAVRDITETKRTQAALKEAEEKYRDIFENAIEGIFQSTPDGKFISANPALARMFGYDSAAQLIGDRNIEREHYVNPQRRKVFKKLIEETGFVQDFELQAYRKDGSIIWTSENVRAVRDESGTLLYYEGIVEDVTRRKEVEEERLALLRRLVRAQEDEQRRISRELHDQMGQSLAALLLGLKSLKDAVPGERPKEQIQRLQDITSRIAEEMHSLIRELRPTALDDLGLHTALSNYIEEWSQQSNITVDFHSNGLLNQRLESQLESTIYRIVQEALNNVMKHAQAQSVSVILEKRGSRVSVIIEDDGIGFDVEELMKTPSSNRRFGLLGMQERVMLVNGSLNIESTPGVGTTVLVHIDTSLDRGGRTND
ncbi:MAG TPA: PAS domain S-box protein [Pyrinomonadaceae bacterium]|nr:PAS domain S-box protein [Pyrinomonadaceae bacterium]